MSWKVANDGTLRTESPSIYHSSSATSNPIVFEEMYRLTIENARKFPPSEFFKKFQFSIKVNFLSTGYIAWMPQLRYHETELADNIDKFFTGFLFVHLMDLLLVIFGQKPKWVLIYYFPLCIIAICSQILMNVKIIRSCLKFLFFKKFQSNKSIRPNNEDG